MEKIKEFLKKKLNLNDNGLEAIELLANGRNIEKRLLACIAIDLKFKLIEEQEIERVLNAIDILECKNSLTECYDKIVDKNNFFTSNISTETNLQLARVMKLSSFKNHYFNIIRPNYIYVETAEELRKQIERDNLNEFYMHNNAIGKGNLVWSTTKEEILEILDNNGSNEVVIRLGLSYDLTDNYDDDFIYIEYPQIFNEELYQPSNFSKNWRDEVHLYISYKQADGFGRTRSRIGDFPEKRMKETVHRSINEPKYKYNVKYLGKFDYLNIKLNNLVEESIGRFQDE